jgi:ribosomal protein S18 acetylase RimI-like enzyme
MAEVRHARFSDWEFLKNIWTRALADSPDAFCMTCDEAAGYNDEVWIERSSTDPKIGSSASLLAIDGDEVVGMAFGLLCNERQLEVVTLFVGPKHRGTGVAQDLVGTIEAWSATRGARTVVLDVEAGNDRAMAFYAGLGYRPTGKRETYPGRVWLHRLELTKSLGDNQSASPMQTPRERAARIHG